MRKCCAVVLLLCLVSILSVAQTATPAPAQESSSRAQPDAPPSPPDAPVPDQGTQTSAPPQSSPQSKTKKVASKFDPHCINVIFHTCWSAPPETNPNQLSEEAQKEQTAAKDVEVGYYYLNEKNYRAAESRLQEATELKPDSAAAWVGLAQSQQKLGKDAAARSSYEQYLKLNPDPASADKAKRPWRHCSTD